MMDGINPYKSLASHDGRTGVVFDIIYDEIDDFLYQLPQRTKNLTVILFSCPSGKIAQSRAMVRVMDSDQRPTSQA